MVSLVSFLTSSWNLKRPGYYLDIYIISRFLDIYNIYYTPGEIPRLHRGKQLGLHGDREQTDR